MNGKVVFYIFSISVFIHGCSYTSVKPVIYTDTTTKGFRVYDPQPILVSNCESTTIGFVPDYSRGYAINVRSVMAKNKSTVKASGGIATELSTELDTAAFLTLIQTLGQEALKQAEKLAGLGASATGGLQHGGIWRMDYDETGRLSGATEIVPPYKCPAAG